MTAPRISAEAVAKIAEIKGQGEGYLPDGEINAQLNMEPPQ